MSKMIMVGVPFSESEYRKIKMGIPMMITKYDWAAARMLMKLPEVPVNYWDSPQPEILTSREYDERTKTKMQQNKVQEQSSSFESFDKNKE